MGSTSHKFLVSAEFFVTMSIVLHREAVHSMFDLVFLADKYGWFHVERNQNVNYQELRQIATV